MQGLVLTDEIEKYIKHNGVACKKVFLKLFLSKSDNYNENLLISLTKKKRYHYASKNDRNPFFLAYVVEKEEAKKKIWQGVRWNDQAIQNDYHFFIVNNIHSPKPFPLYRDEEGNEHELMKVRTYREWYAFNKGKSITISSIYYAMRRGIIDYTCPNDIEDVKTEMEKNTNLLIIFNQKAKDYEVNFYEP